jgi:hypothetical protein
MKKIVNMISEEQTNYSSQNTEPHCDYVSIESHNILSQS